MSNIQIIGNQTYFVQARGQKITVEPSEFLNLGKWLVTTDNAAARVWNNGRCAWRYFDSLEEIEERYKMLKGLVQVHQFATECTNGEHSIQ